MKDPQIITSEDVLKALRLWHASKVPQWPLAHLRLSLQIAPDQLREFGTFVEVGPAAQNRAVLNQGLELLCSVAPEAEDLLRERFEHQRDVIAVANNLNVSESSLYYRQRQAVSQLCQIIVRLEESASFEWQEKMLARLQLPTYSGLVGVERALEELSDILIEREEHFMVALVGLGGIGKTALADKAVRNLIQTTRFDEIAWITAKHTHLSSLGRLQVESGQPTLTFPMVIEQLANQFELPSQNISKLQKERLVKHYLQERSCLVVIDNLETVADFRSLLPELRDWQNPSKFLLTSRFRLLDEPGVYTISMRELNKDAAFELLRQEAQRTGFQALNDAADETLQKIYDVVGGNPLALKLIIGQLRFHSLPSVLTRFAGGGEIQTREELFDYIYQEIWESLDDIGKMTLLALTQAGETGFTMEHLAGVTDISEEELMRSIEVLILLSLVDLAGNLSERRYRLHRLTEVFLLRMFTQ